MGRAGATAKFVAAVLLFGSNGIVARFTGLSSGQAVYLRTLIGVLFLGVLLVLNRPKLAAWGRPRSLLLVAASGASMGLAWLALFEAYEKAGVAIATLEYCTGPLFVMLLSPLFFHERLTARKMAAFAVALVGIVMVNGVAMGAGVSLWGLACGALSALAYTAMVIFNKKAEGIEGMENATEQLFFAFLVVAGATWATTGPVVAVTLEGLPWILCLGLVNTGVGCYLFFSSMGKLSAQSVAVLSCLEILSATALAAVVLGETLTAVQLLGGAFVVIGVTGAQLAARPVDKNK